MASPLEHLLSLHPFGLDNGKYMVEFRISDLVRNTSVRQQVDFEITE